MMFGPIRGGLVRPLCIATLLCVAAIAGCGGDDGDVSADPEQRKFEAASEPPEDFVKRLAKLLETSKSPQDCLQVLEINGRSYTRFPCPPPKSMRESMQRFRVVGAEVYGTGAVVDYRSGKVEDGAAVVLFTAPDRNWGVGRFGVVTERSTGTSDEESREGYQQAVQDYVAAVRERDCPAALAVMFTADKSAKRACKTLPKSIADLAKRLKANPSAEPKYEGGNSTYGFYSLETDTPIPAENLTFSILRAGTGDSEKYLILDIAPSPTSVQQRQVIEALKEQRKNKATQTGPSKKPSDPAVKP
jgi:hypothetical protein